MEEKVILETKTMEEIYDETYMPRLPIVEGLICAGTYIFAGTPKIGKSYFALQLGYHVSKGIDLWDYKTRQGTVLYFALEDNYPRIQKRLGEMCGVEVSGEYHFAIKSKSVKDGLIDQINSFIEKYPKTRLIMIDTLQKIRDSAEENVSYKNDYETIDPLKKLCDEKNICILIIHHTRKKESEDCFDKISGTNGLMGSADGAIVLSKKNRTGNEAVLVAVGRDQPEIEITLERDIETCIWRKIKSEEEIFERRVDPLHMILSKYINEKNPFFEGTASELMAMIPEIKEMVPANVLVRKLNITRYNLLKDFKVFYQKKQRKADRKVFTLTYVENEDMIYSMNNTI